MRFFMLFLVCHPVCARVSSSPSPNPSKRHSTAPACARDLRTSEWSSRMNASVLSTAATATTLMSPAGSAHLPDAPTQDTPAPAATAPRSAGASKPSRCIGSRKTPSKTPKAPKTPTPTPNTPKKVNPCVVSPQTADHTTTSIVRLEVRTRLSLNHFYRPYYRGIVSIRLPHFLPR